MTGAGHLYFLLLGLYLLTYTLLTSAFRCMVLGSRFTVSYYRSVAVLGSRVNTYYFISRNKVSLYM
jgi:hypothetical protein